MMIRTKQVVISMTDGARAMTVSRIMMFSATDSPPDSGEPVAPGNAAPAPASTLAGFSEDGSSEPGPSAGAAWPSASATPGPYACAAAGAASAPSASTSTMTHPRPGLMRTRPRASRPDADAAG